METLKAIKRVIAKRKARGALRSEVCQYLNHLRKDTWKNNEAMYREITALIKAEVREAVKA